jgi:DNA-binding PadR family transcriptional regulator
MDRKLLLLGILRRHQMHGYQLYEFIDQALATCTNLKKPTAYYLLGQMAADGWISEVQEREGNRPPRTVYSLTDQGEAEFQRLLRQNLADFSPAFFPGDAGVAFLDNLDLEDAADLLQQRRAGLAKALEVARQAPLHAGSLQYVVDHQVHHLSSELAWLDQLLARI